MAKRKEKPLTREDVLKLIQKNSGIAKGLNLSGRNLEGIHLASLKSEAPLDLSGIILANTNLKKADLRSANLEGADLCGASLQEADLYLTNLQNAKLQSTNLTDASLYDANLQGASLSLSNLRRAHLDRATLQGASLVCSELLDAYLLGANLQNADLQSARLQNSELRYADLSNARLRGAEISNDTKLDHVVWGPKHIVPEEKDKEFLAAADIYRNLKNWHAQAGLYDLAGDFFFREMEARRKAIWQHYKFIWKFTPKYVLALLTLWYGIRWLWLTLVKALCGYGEKPFRVIMSAAVVVFGSGVIYFALGTLTPNTLLSSLYYSAVSFTALGYGSWAPEPTGWVKGLGALEAFAGVFMMALFLITFVRRMTR